jgi:hypothetical protein
MPCLMREMPGFASKAVMNFKILGVIHRCWPVGRCARHAECEYFPVYLTACPPNASTLLSLHFETDTGLPECRRALIVVRFLCLRRVACACCSALPTPEELHCLALF